MRAKTKTTIICLLIGLVLGGLMAAAYDKLTMQHHYKELETFFRGEVAGKQVLGISYFDYHGLGFMEGNEWKVVLRDPYGADVIIYQNHPVFQESLPYQPEIKIQGLEISIDDGINKLKVSMVPDGAALKQ